ncbi:NAD(P)/FAD-dependent oxidoreductase [Streptomyces sp. BV286]|nr:NAD(P)/FAD-dependent oxidoreductase [Streptomyces sp. BV286]
MNRTALVGASAGGLATVEALRRAGHGGGITLVGDEPYLPYDRPPLSKHFLKGEWELDRLPPRALIASGANWDTAVTVLATASPTS